MRQGSCCGSSGRTVLQPAACCRVSLFLHNASQKTPWLRFQDHSRNLQHDLERATFTSRSSSFPSSALLMGHGVYAQSQAAIKKHSSQSRTFTDWHSSSPDSSFFFFLIFCHALVLVRTPVNRLVRLIIFCLINRSVDDAFYEYSILIGRKVLIRFL